MMLEMTVALRPKVISLGDISGVITATMSSAAMMRSSTLMSGSLIVEEPSICVL